MFKRFSTTTINTILIIGVILLVLEIVFFNGGLIFSLVITGLAAFLGWKNYTRLWGKIVFWFGLITLIFTILSMIAVRFFIIALLFLFLRSYYKSRNQPEEISLHIDDKEELPLSEGPLLSQKFFGDQSTPDTSYSWHDINIHGGFGDRIIDLSQTVLPQDEAVISIRHFVGNVMIYIPYEVEVSIHHSAIIGRAAIFQYRKSTVLNQVLSYKSSDYEKNKPRVKIVTSIVSGDLEVKRV